MNSFMVYPCNDVDCCECPFYEECGYWRPKPKEEKHKEAEEKK